MNYTLCMNNWNNEKWLLLQKECGHVCERLSVLCSRWTFSSVSHTMLTTLFVDCCNMKVHGWSLPLCLHVSFENRYFLPIISILGVLCTYVYLQCVGWYAHSNLRHAITFTFLFFIWPDVSTTIHLSSSVANVFKSNMYMYMLLTWCVLPPVLTANLATCCQWCFGLIATSTFIFLDLERRTVDVEEKKYVIETEIVTETQGNMG